MPDKNGKRQKKRILDFRFYDFPQDEPYLLFYGPDWHRIYGYDEKGGRINNLHFHNGLEIGICTGGHGVIQYDNGESKAYEKNVVSIVPRNIPHNTMNEPGVYADWIWLFIDERPFLSKIDSRNPRQTADMVCRRINCQPQFLSDERADFFRRTVGRIIWEQEQHLLYYRENIHVMIIQLLLMIGRENSDFVVNGRPESKNGTRKFSEVLTYIDEHYQEPLTIHDIASSAGLSESYFRTVFRTDMNTSPLKYLNMIRIQHACTMMVHSDDTIEAIAIKCGFDTVSTFNRNFQKYLHESPLKWRRIHRANNHYLSGMQVTVHHGW